MRLQNLNGAQASKCTKMQYLTRFESTQSDSSINGTDTLTVIYIKFIYFCIVINTVFDYSHVSLNDGDVFWEMRR